MNFFRKNIVARFFICMLAFHIFNCSIDSPDMLPPHQPENTGYNDIESFTELLTENILSIEDAVPEHDEADNTESSSQDTKNISLFFEKRSTRLPVMIWRENHMSVSPFSNGFYSFSYQTELNPPPEHS